MKKSRGMKCFRLTREDRFDEAVSVEPVVVGHVPAGSPVTAFGRIKRQYELSHRIRLNKKDSTLGTFEIGTYLFTLTMLPVLPPRILS